MAAGSIGGSTAGSTSGSTGGSTAGSGHTGLQADILKETQGTLFVSVRSHTSVGLFTVGESRFKMLYFLPTWTLKMDSID